MPDHNIAQLAQDGDVSAISSLINKAVRPKGITATIEIENGDLDVMLDARKVPPLQAAAFIHKGISNLNIESIYTAHVYGRIAGQPFATWHKKFDLRPRPFGGVAASTTPNKQQTQYSSDSQKAISITLGSNTITVDPNSSQTIEFVGVAIMVAGIFAPMMSLSVAGTLDFLGAGMKRRSPSSSSRPSLPSFSKKKPTPGCMDRLPGLLSSSA